MFYVICDYCEKEHIAEYSHEGNFDEGSIYEVNCTEDHLSDFYTFEKVYSK